MKKRNLILGSIALLLVIVGTWGILEIRARTSVRAALGNITAHSSPTDQTSLYKTGTLLIPTVKVSTSTANCDPKHIPRIASDPAHGIDEAPIKPHLCSIPTFTEQDVRQYMRTVTRFTGIRIRQTSPDYMITRILFITNGVANDPNGLKAITRHIEHKLIVCYEEFYGNITVTPVSDS